MCGIAGSINHPLNISVLTRDLWHRGPDEQSTFSENNVLLHHHRLSILDIAGGRQPMHYEHLTIIFNGEIYNHQEVREKRKLKCLTNSDTETILRSYAELGAECLTDFDGMFAFVIYDRKNHCLFLARDRAGKKPLYFYQGKSSFVFASELNALRKQVSVEVNKASVELFVRYGTLHGSMTPYQNIKELRPGHYAYVNINTPIAEEKKWWGINSFYEQKRNDTERKLYQLLIHTYIQR